MHTCFAHFENIINDQINICLMLLEERLFITLPEHSLFAF